MPVIHEQPSRPVQTENGPRYAQQWEYKGTQLEVATGYDVVSDSWPYHVYAITANGRERLHLDALVASDMRQAFAEGFQLAKTMCDAGEMK